MLGQALQLIDLGDTILIQVLPNADIGELFILSVEYAIGIAIQVTQGIKAVSGQLTIGLDGINAEQLLAGIDRAVTVAVKH